MKRGWSGERGWVEGERVAGGRGMAGGMHSLSLQPPAPSPSPAVRHYVAKRRGVNSALGTLLLPLAPVYPIRTNNGCDSSRDKVTFTNPPHPAPALHSPHPPQFLYNQHPYVPTSMPASSNSFCYDDRYIILFVCFEYWLLRTGSRSALLDRRQTSCK